MAIQFECKTVLDGQNGVANYYRYIIVVLLSISFLFLSGGVMYIETSRLVLIMVERLEDAVFLELMRVFYLIYIVGATVLMAPWHRYISEAPWHQFHQHGAIFSQIPTTLLIVLSTVVPIHY
jgi:hypothetical protein